MAAQAMVLSKPMAADLLVYRGDSGKFRVTVTDDVGTPINVSAATWACEIRTAADDTTVLATLDVTPVVGDDASVDVALTPAESAKLTSNGVWDLQMTLAGDVTTLLSGKATVTKDVSR